MCFISGENDPYVHTVRKRVCCRTSLPSGFMLNSSCHCFDQSAARSGVVREELNMMREPSADQCGCESSPLVRVSAERGSSSSSRRVSVHYFVTKGGGAIRS